MISNITIALLAGTLLLLAVAVALPMRLAALFRQKATGPEVRLHQFRHHKWRYWEVRTDVDGTHIVHWGRLGETGTTKSLPASERDDVLEELALHRTAGFAELGDDDLYGLEIDFAVRGIGEAEARDRRHRAEAHLNQLLNGTGLGRIEGGSAGAGSMEVLAYVVDPEAATRLIEADLGGSEWADYTAIKVRAPRNTARRRLRAVSRNLLASGS